MITREEKTRKLIAFISELDDKCRAGLVEIESKLKSAKEAVDAEHKSRAGAAHTTCSNACSSADQMLAAFERDVRSACAFVGRPQAPAAQVTDPLNEYSQLPQEWSVARQACSEARKRAKSPVWLWIVSWAIGICVALLTPLGAGAAFLIGLGVPLGRWLYVSSTQTASQKALLDLYQRATNVVGHYKTEMTTRMNAEVARADANRQQASAKAESLAQKDMLKLRGSVSRDVDTIRAALRDIDSGFEGAHWLDSRWNSWNRGVSVDPDIRIGMFSVAAQHIEAAVPGSGSYLVPAFIRLSSGSRNVLIKSEGTGKLASECMQGMILRILMSVPPGRIRFHFFDPVGLGNNVAGFAPLEAYGDVIMVGKPWTNADHINSQLGRLTGEIEKVIGKFLQRKFKTIDEYNLQAEVKEPYHVIAVFGFPNNFHDEAVSRLLSIVRNGPRCGYYAVIHWDTSKSFPYNVSPSDLEKHCVTITDAKARISFQA